MARLLGRFQVPGCCPGTRAGWQPGPDCSGGGSMGRRAAKRQEVRELARDLRDDLADLLGLPDEDQGECQHGCKGTPSCTGPDCTFICHPR